MASLSSISLESKVSETTVSVGGGKTQFIYDSESDEEIREFRKQVCLTLNLNPDGSKKVAPPPPTEEELLKESAARKEEEEKEEVNGGKNDYNADGRQQLKITDSDVGDFWDITSKMNGGQQKVIKFIKSLITKIASKGNSTSANTAMLNKLYKLQASMEVFIVAYNKMIENCDSLGKLLKKDEVYVGFMNHLLSLGKENYKAIKRDPEVLKNKKDVRFYTPSGTVQQCKVSIQDALNAILKTMDVSKDEFESMQVKMLDEDADL